MGTPPFAYAVMNVDRRMQTGHVAVLVALPFLITWLIPDWFLPLPSSIDPWVYNGFFRHLDDYNSPTVFPRTYYGTRLAWILPGHALYSMFGAEQASFILHGIYYCVAVAAIYWITRQVADAAAAFISAASFALFLPVIRGLGDDYVAAGVLTYSLLSTAFALAAARRRHWHALMFISGVFGAAMFHSNIVSAFLVPSILIWIVPATLARAAWLRAIQSVLLWGAGFVCCTALLGWVGLDHGSPFLFFVPSFTWMVASWSTNPWDEQGWSWIHEVPWTLLSAAVAVAGVAACVQAARRAALDGPRIRAAAAFALIFGLFLVWDLLGSSAVLYWPFYASWLMPTAFVALGAVVFGTAAPSRGDWWVLIAIIPVLLASLVRADLVPIWFKTPGLIALFALAVATGAVPRRGMVGALACAVLVYLNVWSSSTGFFATERSRLDVFRTVDLAVREIDQHSPRDRQPRFLYNERDRKFGSHSNAIAGVYLWGYSIASREYPKVDGDGAKLLPAGTVATIMSDEAYDANQLDRALAPYGLKAELITGEQIETARGPLHLTFVRTLERPK